MERLTSREGNKIFIDCGDRIDITPEETREMVVNRLAAYEDTGLTPKEVEVLKECARMKR